MAGSSLLLLIDDIASVLADVAVMTKVAAKKTAGVLGDDLALNAQQVAGVAADRELPVVWAVSKGSLRNKAILVPLALAISAFVPWVVMPLLMLGGLFLCFEGVEKLAHRFLHGQRGEDPHHAELLKAVADPTIDLVAFENERIEGAIRTDFILSAEVVVITLGAVAEAGFVEQVAVLCTIALAMTVGVYGLVAAIIKLDDLGYHLHQKRGAGQALQRALGGLILRAAPVLMKTLSVVGTAAMFMVGGAILVHGSQAMHHFVEHASQTLGSGGAWTVTLATVLLESVIGIVAGALALAVYSGGKRLFGAYRPAGR